LVLLGYNVTNIFQTIQARPKDFVLVSPFGLGDTYYLCAFASAFRDKHCKGDSELYLAVKKSHFELANQFDVTAVAFDDHFLHHHGGRCERIAPGQVLYPHPHFMAPGAMVPGHLSDAAMYATILGLPATTPLALPESTFQDRQLAMATAHSLGAEPGKTAVLFPQTNSWPGAQEPFWTSLAVKLAAKGWKVIFNNPQKIELRLVFPFVEYCGWAIGNNCGMMQNIILSQSKCRTTVILQSSVLGGPAFPRNGIPYTCMYGMRKLDGNDYDIDEFRVDGPQDYPELVNLISNSRFAKGETPHVGPLEKIEMPVSPGDVIDTLTIMQIKRKKLHTSHMIYSQIAPYCEARDWYVARFPSILVLEQELLKLNEIAWDNNQILIDTYSEQTYPHIADYDFRDKAVIIAFGKAHRANQQRVRVKNEINRICAVRFREEKSYAT
jgi:hypothetical protein